MGFDLGDYVQVKDRIAEFWHRHPDGRIICQPPAAVEIDGRSFIASHVSVYTEAFGDAPAATGSAWEAFPGRTPYTKDSEAMNAETSAIGRALGALGIGIDGSMASADEVQNRVADREAADRGMSSREAKNRLVEYLDGKVSGDATKHAAAIWKEADREPPLSDEDFAHLTKTADEYLADLEAMSTDAALDAIVHDAEMDKAGDR